MYSNISCSMEVGTPVVARVDLVIIQQGLFGINRRFCCGGYHTQVSVATVPLSASPPLVLLSPKIFTHCQLQDACRPWWEIQRRVYSCWFHHCLCFFIACVFLIVFVLFCRLNFLDLWGLSTHSWGRPVSIKNFLLLRLLKHSTVRRGSGIFLSHPLCCQHEDDIVSFRLSFGNFFSPPSPPTKESNQAMVRSNSNSTSNRPQQTGNNLWSSEDASRQPQRAQRRKAFTRSLEVL